jgi:hypothetical protein
MDEPPADLPDQRHTSLWIPSGEFLCALDLRVKGRAKTGGPAGVIVDRVLEVFLCGGVILDGKPQEIRTIGERLARASIRGA